MVFNLIDNENAIIPNMILRTVQDMDDMLKELKISTKGPIKHGGMAIKHDTIQCSVFDPEIVVDKQFMQSVSDSFSQCSAMNARINQKLDELDEIMSKSIDISRYTKDEKAVLTQVQTIYETLHSTLQSIIDSGIANDYEYEVISKTENPFMGSVDAFHNRGRIRINSSQYNDNIRTRRRTYMRWINGLKECIDSIQNAISYNTPKVNQAEPATTQSSPIQNDSPTQNADKESNKDIQPHQRNPFL